MPSSFLTTKIAHVFRKLELKYFEIPERNKALGQQAGFPERWQGKNPSKLKTP